MRRPGSAKGGIAMLNGKVAVVTGGSRGIGRAIAIEMARAGADVAILYAGNEQAAAETLEMIQQLGRKGAAYQCDVSKFDAAKQAVDSVLQTFGGIDILVNNAGVTRDALSLAMREEQFDQVIDTNLKGAFHMIRHVVGHMMRKRAGRIINISSVSGLSGNAGQCNYAAAKAGLIGMTKSVAKETAGRSITVNAIAPGFIDTDMTAALPETVREAAIARIPAGRTGMPEEVAGLALFLASDAAAYITGEVIRVDGGLCM